MAAAGRPTTYQQPYLPARPRSAKLAGVKFGIYNPHLPTLRKMDRDDVIQKLSSAHSRTSTPCSREDFETFQQNREKHYDKEEGPASTYGTCSSSPTRYTEDWNAVFKATMNTKLAHPFKTGGSVVPRLMPATMYSRYRSSRPHIFYHDPWK